MNENLRNLISDKFSEHRETPPDFVWEKISDKLDQKTKTKKIVFLKSAAAVITILISFAWGYFVGNSPDNILIVEQKNKNIVSPITEVHTIEEKKLNTNPNSLPEQIQTKHTLSKEKEIKYFKTAPNQLVAEQHYSSLSMALEKDSTTVKVRQNLQKIKPLVAYVETQKQEPVLLKPKNYTTVEDKDQFFDEIIRQKNRQNKWALGVSVGTGKSEVESQYSTNLRVDQIETNSENSTSYNLGMNLSYRLTDRISLSTGIRYSTMAQSQSTSYRPNFENNHRTLSELSVYEDVKNYASNSLGKVNYLDNRHSNVEAFNVDAKMPTERVEEELAQKLEFVELPLNLKFNLWDSFFKLSVNTGASLNMLVGNHAKLKLQNITHNSETEGLNKYNFAGILGLGVHYPINKHIVLNFTPNVKYFFNSINKDVSYKPVDFNIQTGLSFVLP